MTALQPKTREAVLQIAAWQIGVLESPSGSNRQKYGEAYGINGVAWCMIFVWWVFREAGFSLFRTASCSVLASRYKEAGQWVTGHYKPGDIVMFDFSGKRSKTQHVGIVERVYTDGTVVTIEGNTGTGNDTNGGAVMRRTRAAKYITGACRPGYNL